MNLPRHSITSHAITPIFNNAHFTNIQSHDHQRPKERAEKKGHDRPNRRQEGRQSVGMSPRTSSEYVRQAKLDSKSSSRPGSSSSSTNKKAPKDEEKAENVNSKNMRSGGASTSQTGNMFACATNDGFFIARTEPFRIVTHRKFTALQGGLAHVALINDSSLVVLVGGGRVPRFAPNKVILWDECAEYQVSISASSKGERARSEEGDAVSEGTASPIPSTIFSLRREESVSLMDELEIEEDKHNIEEEEKEGEVIESSMGMSKTSNAIASGILPAMIDESALIEGKTDLKEEQGDSSTPSQSYGEIKDDDSEEMEAVTSIKSSSASVTQDNSQDPLPISSTDRTDPFAEPFSYSDEASTDSIKNEEGTTSFPATKKSTDTEHDVPLERSKVEQRTERGREVAELEFGEAVQSIRVESFCKHEDDEQDTAEGNEAAQASSERQGDICILVVILQTKAVIFEMGTHLHNFAGVDGKLPSKNQWGIRQRFVLDIHPDSNRCRPALSQIERTNCALIALPGRQIGHVQLVCVEFSHTKRTSIHSSMAGASTIIAAHTNAIACLELSKDGRYLCTASDRGTILRFWSTISAGKSGKLINQRFPGSSGRVNTMAAALLGELRRGSESARILSIAITPDDRFLAVASDKGTIHFFNLDSLQNGVPLASGKGEDAEFSLQRFSPLQSTTHSSGGFKLSQTANRFLPNAIQNFAQQIPTSLLPQYFKSQWSFAQFRIRLQVFSGRMMDGMRHVKPPKERRNMPLKEQKGKGRQAQDVENENESDREGSEEERQQQQQQQQKTFIGDAFVPDRARNYEGGWAQMRGRVNDIRKGERTIQEGIWLDWTFAKEISSSHQDEKAREEEEEEGFHLIAITSSGSLYRLAISTKPSASPGKVWNNDNKNPSNASSSTILDMYKSDTSDSSKAGTVNAADVGSCTLVEHFRFGKRDEWLD